MNFSLEARKPRRIQRCRRPAGRLSNSSRNYRRIEPSGPSRPRASFFPGRVRSMPCCSRRGRRAVAATTVSSSPGSVSPDLRGFAVPSQTSKPAFCRKQFFFKQLLMVQQPSFRADQQAARPPTRYLSFAGPDNDFGKTALRN